MKKIFLVLFALVLSSVAADARRNIYPKPQYGDPNDYLVDVYEAERIMGNHFFGAMKLELFFGATLDRRIIDRMNMVPFKKSTLMRCVDCILFYYLPKFGAMEDRTTIWNLLSSRKMHIKGSFSDNRRTAWYKDERWARTPAHERWYLIRTRVSEKPVPAISGGFSLGSREEIAPAAVYVYAMLLNKSLFHGRSVLTSDHNDGNKWRVLVGRPNGKISIFSVVSPELGVAAEILPDDQRIMR